MLKSKHVTRLVFLLALLVTVFIMIVLNISRAEPPALLPTLITLAEETPVYIAPTEIPVASPALAEEKGDALTEPEISHLLPAQLPVLDTADSEIDTSAAAEQAAAFIPTTALTRYRQQPSPPSPRAQPRSAWNP